MEFKVTLVADSKLTDFRFVWSGKPEGLNKAIQDAIRHEKAVRKEHEALCKREEQAEARDERAKRLDVKRQRDRIATESDRYWANKGRKMVEVQRRWEEIEDEEDREISLEDFLKMEGGVTVSDLLASDSEFEEFDASRY